MYHAMQPQQLSVSMMAILNSNQTLLPKISGETVEVN